MGACQETVCVCVHEVLLPPTPLQVCVFTAPLFSGFCCIATYLFMREVRGPGAGLASAVFIAIVPSYISRSGVCVGGVTKWLRVCVCVCVCVCVSE